MCSTNKHYQRQQTMIWAHFAYSHFAYLAGFCVISPTGLRMVKSG